MLSQSISSGVYGIEAQLVEIEIDIIKGLPTFTIVGLPDSTIRESKERIRSAIENSGYEFPPRNFVVNLAPAWFKKQGANFDLPVALSILSATEQISIDLSCTPLIGELSLNGSVKPVRGIISMTIALYKAGYEKIIVPYENRHEAAAIDGISVFPVRNILEAINIFKDTTKPFTEKKTQVEKTTFSLDFKDVKGQESAKRAVEIAAAGQHNILLYGPPGSGKTMMAKRIPSILPRLVKEKSLLTTMIHSVGGTLRTDTGLIEEPPFRSPHHTSSDAALVGGGRIPSVGEISLAHNGVLFMDEFVEFKNNVIQSLRQPLEDCEVVVSRASGRVNFPADFMLVASSNPCHCGYLFDPDIECKCPPSRVRHYFSKIAGPILDRIDIEALVARVPYQNLMNNNNEESSGSIRERVLEAREKQAQRFQKKATSCNARMTNSEIKEFCRIDTDTEHIFELAVKRLNLSARSFFRILKVARTISDLDRGDSILKKHLLEALSYKNLQKNYEV